jgi:hypothetical protein
MRRMPLRASPLQALPLPLHLQRRHLPLLPLLLPAAGVICSSQSLDSGGARNA